ncbi:MAG: ATP-grasp domain-containing protein [Steroidobacteraceae bacterium]|jgi:formate-dependent phosphoribosylglycinamide formyltransferase (GAR transformylase)|nr:ATP-grasp domain-containing protein [Steroidobacteraceae bacterium]
MNVIFVEPAFPHNQREFVRGLCAVGARVIGIGERPVSHLDGELKQWLADYEQVGSVVDEAAMLAAVKRVQKRVWVDRLEATVEAHVMTSAKVREACGIPGTSVRTAWLCRDKPAMKAALREAGVPCAQSIGVDSLQSAHEFAASVGYPLVVKPRSGAGASGTTRVDTDAELAQALRAAHVDRGASVALEEFVEGHEGFIDTIAIQGRVAHEFVSHYYPGVLVAMRERWISPQIAATNRLDAPGYAEVRAMTRRVIEVLGIGTSATHMEWFFGPKGLKFSEIGCRPPGVGQWDVYAAANEFDIFREWGMAIAHGRTLATPSRRYACGMIALRPDRDGRITGYEGADRVWAKFGEWIVAAHLPPPGTPTQPIEAGYMANAWIRIRHPDYDHLRWMMDTIGATLRVRAQ